MSDRNERESHPAYGLVQFSRVTGGERKLFGSQVKCSTTIRLRIHQAQVEHSLGSDHYFSEGMLPFVEVELSPAQFSELLTTMNVGSGVPCTILTKNGKSVERIPETLKPEVQKVQESFVKDMKELVDRLQADTKKVEELLEKKSLTKEDRKTISWVMGKTLQDVQSNFPFMLEQFSKSAQKVASQVKAEIDAFQTHGLTVLGLEAIKEGKKPSFPQIGNQSEAEKD